MCGRFGCRARQCDGQRILQRDQELAGHHVFERRHLFGHGEDFGAFDRKVAEAQQLHAEAFANVDQRSDTRSHYAVAS